MKTLGRHLIIELYDCDPTLLDDIDRVRERMLEAVSVIGATALGDIFRPYAPQGVSGTVVIAESHLSIHTWPQNGYAAVDIFTCGGLDPRPGFELLATRFRAASVRTQEIIRGLPDHLESERRLLPEDVVILTDTAPPRSMPRRTPITD